jgi:hypothetical protein
MSGAWMKQLHANLEFEPRRPDHLPIGTTVEVINRGVATVVGYFPDDDDMPVHVVQNAHGARYIAFAHELIGANESHA